jgi:hypothetical protein
VLPHVTSDTPAHQFDVTSWKIPNDINLADEHFYQLGPIDLLIGAKLFYELLLSNNRTCPGHPVLQETVLGWIISGSTPVVTTFGDTSHTFMVQETNIEANQSDGRFIVQLPVKRNPNQLGTSFRSANSRLLAIEQRLDKNPELNRQYHYFMQEYDEADSNRVALIQEATSSATWRHVPTRSNHADLTSRDRDLQGILWRHSPNSPIQEYQLATVSWPHQGSLISRPIHKRSQSLGGFARSSPTSTDSSIIAVCKRFINNCRQPANRQTASLSTQELDQALTCVKTAQRNSYAQEVTDLLNSQEVSTTSSLKTLHPLIDQEGLIRVGGRLQHSILPYDTMHPVILHPDHHFTKLVVSAEHIRLHHAGPQLLIASLRQKYWIPRIRNVVKAIIYQCLPCYRFKAQASKQLMGELPST